MRSRSKNLTLYLHVIIRGGSLTCFKSAACEMSFSFSLFILYWHSCFSRCHKKCAWHGADHAFSAVQFHSLFFFRHFVCIVTFLAWNKCHCTAGLDGIRSISRENAEANHLTLSFQGLMEMRWQSRYININTGFVVQTLCMVFERKIGSLDKKLYEI